MQTLTVIIFQLILKKKLDEVDEAIVNVIFKLHSNSCVRNIYLSDDVLVMFLIQFEVT